MAEINIPIWAKDRTGKYRVFPYDLLESLSDGRLYIKGLDVIHRDRAWRAYNDFPGRFEYSVSLDAYILKGSFQKDK